MSHFVCDIDFISCTELTENSLLINVKLCFFQRIHFIVHLNVGLKGNNNAEEKYDVNAAHENVFDFVEAEHNHNEEVDDWEWRLIKQKGKLGSY